MTITGAFEREAILRSPMIKVAFYSKDLCSLGSNNGMSAASSFLYQQASLSPGEFTSNTELERAIDCAGLAKGASPVDAFDDDPPLLGTAPAVKRFLTCW